MEKREIGKYSIMERYFVILLVLVVLVSFLLFFGSGEFLERITGFAVFQQSNGSAFNEGSYNNTEWNGSSLVLSGDNTSGSYTSKVFDAGDDASWNNISVASIIPISEYLYAVDGAADVFRSTNGGGTWTLLKDDYNNGDANGADYLIRNSSQSLFIMNGQDIWVSNDFGVTWTKVNDNYNGGETNNGITFGINSSDDLFIMEGDQDVWISTDSGSNFAKVSLDFNGGNGNLLGMAANTSDALFAVDAQADVWLSTDDGVTWSLLKDDYNGGNGNNADDMAINSSDDLFILHGQDVWHSTDNGVSWILVSDDFNPSDTNDGIVMYVDDSDDVYIIDGSEDVWKSTNSGQNFSRLVSDMNGGNGNAFGLSSASVSGNLAYKVKNCSSPDCSDGSWQTVDLNNINLQSRYFQYKVEFSTNGVTPLISSITLDYTILNNPPVLNLILPQNGTTYGYNTSLKLNFSVSDSDGNLESCWYHIDNGANVSLAGCANTTFNVAEGSHSIIIYANDTNGEKVSDSASFSVQVGAPTITLNYPIGIYIDSNNIVFNYTPDDVDLDSCMLWGNFDGEFKLNQTDLSPVNGMINNFSLSLGDGTYAWNIQCNDSAGNSAFNGNKTFYVDTTAPQLSLSEPSGTKTSRTGIPLTFSITESSPVNCSYNLTTSIGTAVVSNVNIANCSSTSFDVSSDGDYILILYAEDAAEHSGKVNSSFSVVTSSGGSGGSGGGGGGSGGGGGGYLINESETEDEVDLVLSFRFGLELSELGEVVARAGERKTLSLEARNSGTSFLNDCRLVSEGDLQISSEQLQGIAPGQRVNFILNFEMPDDTKIDKYMVNLEIRCEEASSSQELIVILPKISQLIEVQSIEQKGNILEIVYVLDSSGMDSDDVIISIKIFDEEGNELKSYSDYFPLNNRDSITREISITLDEEFLSGAYKIRFSLGDGDSWIQESVVITGEAISFISSKNRVRGYIVFAGLIILIVLAALMPVMKFMRKKKGR